MKDIPNYEGLYAATEEGQIWSYYKKRFLTPSIGKGGYLKVTLVKDKQKQTKLIHRLIAETFIENPNNYPVVNHKNEDKTNNNITNLEWCTYEYNSNYGTLKEKAKEKIVQYRKEHPDFMKGKNNHKSVAIRCIETGDEFETFTDAIKWCGLKSTVCFTDYFKGLQKSVGRHPITKEKLHWEKIERNN